MNPINNNILVEFEAVPKTSGLLIPERYLIQSAEKDGEQDAVGVTTDRRLINPQTVKILSGEHAGRRGFVHYGAYELAKWYIEAQAIIPGHMLFMLIDPIRTLPGVYLGDEVFTEGEKTASGIYITPYADKKEGVIIKLTYVPENSNLRVGETVITIDNYQYPLTLEGKKHIRLFEREIIGLITETVYSPLGDKIHVKYLPDQELEEIIAENARREDQRKTFRLRNMKEMLSLVEDLREPITVKAEVIAIGEGVKYFPKGAKTLLIRRNYGCMLPDKTWIISEELILWAFTNGEGIL